MESESYVKAMKTIQKSILEFIENDNDSESNYQKLIKLFNDRKIGKNKAELTEVLELISNVSNNHHRTPNFHSKIERILAFFKIYMMKHFTNQEIFDIFKNNKRIILFLIQNKTIFPFKYISRSMGRTKKSLSNYLYYFFPETEPFYHKKLKHKSELEKEKMEELSKLHKTDPHIFEEKRQIGENDSEICKLIRNDSIDEFTSFLNENQIPITSTIEPSIYETNPYLIENNPTLIEYSAFFGSIQIFKYFVSNNVELNSSLWNYAIHSQNLELIHLLEENNVQPEDGSYLNCFAEAIKCHHNEIAEYIKNKFLNGQLPDDFDVLSKSIPYYNYAYFAGNLENEHVFYNLCQYNYLKLTEILLKSKNFDINKKIEILTFVF